MTSCHPTKRSSQSGWDTRPLRDDDAFWESPKNFDDGTPQFFVVTVTVDGHPNVHLADMSSPVWIRDYFIADWASDEISEDTREPRPECPLHRNTVMLADMDSDRVIWKCTRDDSIRCDLGRYWTWRGRSLTGSGTDSGAPQYAGTVTVYWPLGKASMIVVGSNERRVRPDRSRVEISIGSSMSAPIKKAPVRGSARDSVCHPFPR